MVHFLFAIYVFKKNPRKRSVILFSIFALSLAIWAFSEFGHRIANEPTTAIIWMKIGGLGWCFMPSLCCHFVLVFARKKRLEKNLFTYTGLYLPPTIILYLFLTTDLIYVKAPIKKPFGYTAAPGDLVWLYAIYYIILYIFIIYLLIDIIRTESGIKKKQAKPLLIGSGIYIILSTTTNIILPESSIFIPELGTFFSIIWAISVYYSVHNYHLFDLEPSVENHINTPRKYDLKEGEIYYIFNDDKKIYQCFYDQIIHGYHGLCITKYIPEKIKEKYNFIKTPVIQLTFNDRLNAISPGDINGIHNILIDFMYKADRSCILIDCLHQIRMVNGSERTVELINQIHNECQKNGAIALISADSDLIENQKINELNFI